jgi:hypothetical protein
VQACKVLREEGYEVVLVNSNPATIMTDPEFADATYVEPLPTDGSPPTVDVLGNGINTGPDGYAIIKNIPPGNYKVTARPRDGQPWKQTTAIGGGPFIPVVVKAGEPPFLDQGLGLLNMHVALGFVKPFNDLAPGGTGTITGRCVNEHSPHPPSAVIIDTETLDTLPARELTAGWCEAVKMGAVGSRKLFVVARHLSNRR